MEKAVVVVWFAVAAALAAPALARQDSNNNDDAYAQQVHISLGATPDVVVVTWSTMASAARSDVAFGPAARFPGGQTVVVGVAERFVDNGTLHHTQYIHRATLTNLQAATRYVYRVWNDTQFSRLFSFATPPTTQPRFTVFGDMGLTNPQALPALLAEARAGVSDVVVHVGDFAYDMWRDNATFGDRWFNQVQDVAASQPYMVCPGNHEGLYDFLNYRMRFSMPMRNVSSNLYSSWTVGPTHWISYDTEVYFVYEAMTGHGGVHRNFGPYPELARQQLAFVEADLKRAAANRDRVPWIIAYGHRPMYCSDSDDQDCVLMLDQWKNDLEALFYQYGVDLVIEAHQHSYERLWPVFNGTVLNGTTAHPYTNPRAPVHIVAGAAGCDEDLGVFGPPLGPWSALRVSDYGYGHLTPLNATHLHWEQLHKNGVDVVDEIMIVKDEPWPVFARPHPHHACSSDPHRSHHGWMCVALVACLAVGAAVVGVWAKAWFTARARASTPCAKVAEL